MNKSKIILLSTLAVLSLTACSSKSETSPQSVAETPAPIATSTPQPTATPIPDNHDFDLYIDQFKDENNIEINLDDIGNDISDIDSLHDWLYNNGVDRISVQNDRDSGCKNPYLDGYLEYLDNLDKPSETPSKSLDDYEVAEDGEIIIDDWAERFGSSSDMQNGFDGIVDRGDELGEKVASGELQKKLEEIQARHPDIDM